MTPPTTTPDLATALLQEFLAEIARRGMTQASIAGACEWTTSGMSRRMNRHTALTVWDAEKIARALGAPLSEFIRRAEWRIDGEAVAS